MNIFMQITNHAVWTCMISQMIKYTNIHPNKIKLIYISFYTTVSGYTKHRIGIRNDRWTVGYKGRTKTSSHIAYRMQMNSSLPHLKRFGRSFKRNVIACSYHLRAPNYRMASQRYSLLEIAFSPRPKRNIGPIFHHF